MIFEPFTIKNVTFKNRILRSSIGGKTCYYDGTVSPAWKRFETRFAEQGVGGIISATVTVDERRWAPLEYPKLSQDRFIKPIRDAVRAVQAHDCKYILQLGDGGYHTQTSLLPQVEDSKSASSLFDLVFGYGNRSTAMTVDEIHLTIQNFADGARRVRDAGCDGVEITASKGYIIHQFLNPATNRRTDAYGGSVEKRFQFLREVVQAVRRTVGDDFLFGVRLSAVDFNYLPVNLRWPVVFPLRHYFMGNGLKETLSYGRDLARLGVDYLHISAGFGFLNPKESPGDWPVDEYRLYANATRHLSAKANVRAMLLNMFPRRMVRAIFGMGWGYKPAINADYARAFKQAVSIPVIANGGFQRRETIDHALTSGQCDLVAMARPLLANPNLLTLFKQGINEPAKPCSYCNRCSVATAVLPLGCYDRSRFPSQDAMEAQILWWSGGPGEQSSA
jgi:2,4-dienoyl-CoA reductase-like NADH-dependent reductase (Old Yellow Enzyme family)